jgi:hypothetical protein
MPENPKDKISREVSVPLFNTLPAGAALARRSIVGHDFLAARRDETGDDTDIGAGGQELRVAVGNILH